MCVPPPVTRVLQLAKRVLSDICRQYPMIARVPSTSSATPREHKHSSTLCACVGGGVVITQAQTQTQTQTHTDTDTLPHSLTLLGAAQAWRWDLRMDD